MKKSFKRILLVIVPLMGITLGCLLLQFYAVFSPRVESGSYLVLDLVAGTVWTAPCAPKDGWPMEDKTNRLVLRQIKAGTFLMGADSDPESLIVDDGPKPRVTLTHDYYLGVFEVTRGQWRHVVKDTADDSLDPNMADVPVDNVTRERAERFLAALGRRFPAYTFSLPTEAEWEYAGKAQGTCSQSDVWNETNSDRCVHPVGQLQPNTWGLYDVCGNVWEWCSDVESVYGAAPVIDPVHPALPGTSPLFAARGGSWRNRADVCTTVHRAFFFPDIDIIPIGLRVACRQKKE